MQPDDSVLLRQYAENHSDAAFTALVERHLNLVYSVALRQTGDPHDAREIAQAVFIILARKAGSLRHDKALSSWLFQTTRLAANNFIRSGIRRLRREQEAYMQSLLNEPTDDTWRRIAPMLDDAVGTLAEKDRRAILLRFYEGRNLREVGALLGAGEDAAEKRVARALEKLRKIFLKQGINSTTAAIAGTMFANSVQVAPVGLAKTISTVAFTKGAATSTSTLTLVKGELKVMAGSKIKTTIAGVAIALLGIGGTALVVNALLPVPDIQGTWEGTNVVDTAAGYGVHKGEMPKIPIVLRIARVNGAYQANFDNIGWGLKDIEFDTFTYKYPYVHGQYEGINCVCEVDRFGKKISWTSWENNHPYKILFRRTIHPTPFPEPVTDDEFAPRADSDLQGFWVGQIGQGKNALHVQAKVTEASDGTFRADGYSPDQYTNRIPAAVSYDGTNVKLIPLNGYGMFEGQLRNGGKEMAGNWIENGVSTPMTATQADYSKYKVRAAN